MKKLSKILAVLLTFCLLCGLVVTTVFADNDASYTHPGLTPSGANAVRIQNSEGGHTATIHATRFNESSVTTGEEIIDGTNVKNKYLSYKSPSDAANSFWVGTGSGWNERSSYIQLRVDGSYSAPTYYLGNYNTEVNKITNAFDYLTIDFDIAATGVIIEYSDGSFATGTDSVTYDSGEMRATLSDGSFVVTSADKTTTTVTATDGTVTTYSTGAGGFITITEVAPDGSKTVSTTSVDSAGVATKRVSEYGTGGALINSYTITRSAVAADGSYTITHSSGMVVSYKKSQSTQNGYVEDEGVGSYNLITVTETLTVTDGSDTCVYEIATGYKGSISQKTIVSYVCKYTKNGALLATLTNTYKKSANTFQKVYAEGFDGKNFDFDAEVNALPSISDADINGKHIESSKLSYPTISMYNTLRFYNSSDKLVSKYNYYYISYLNGSFGIFKTSSVTEGNRIATLPDEVGTWSHITILIEADNENWLNSKIHFLLNGELLNTDMLSSKAVLNSSNTTTYKYLGIEDWRMTINNVMPGAENYYSFALDNVAINAYKPTVTANEDGTSTRTPYSSGDGVNGIDDFCANLDTNKDLRDYQNVVCTKDYAMPNGYATVDGVKYYFADLAAAAISAAKPENNERFTTAIDIDGIKIENDVNVFYIDCDNEMVNVTLDTASAKNYDVIRVATGYMIQKSQLYPAGDLGLGITNNYDALAVGNFSANFGSGAGDAGTYSTSKVVVGAGGNQYLQYATKAGSQAHGRYRRDYLYGDYQGNPQNSTVKISDYSYITLDFDVAADKYIVDIGYQLNYTSSSASTTVDGVKTVTYTYSYFVQPVQYIFENATRAEIEQAIAEARATLITKIDSAASYLKNGRADSVSADGKTVSKYIYKSHAFDGNAAITADTVGADYAAALDAYDYDKAMDTKRLAYSDTMNFSLDNRAYTTANATSYTSGYSALNVALRYFDGEWKIYMDGNDTGFALSNELGEWNHFTYTIQVTKDSSGHYRQSKVRLYYNGEFVKVANINTNNSGIEIIPRGLDWYDHDSSAYEEQKFSVGIDNFAINYYAKGYKSEGFDGIDDLYADTKGNLVDYKDIVYNANYIPPLPTGYVQLNGGELNYLPTLVKRALAGLKNDDKISSTESLFDFTIPDGVERFEFKAYRGAEIVIANDQVNGYIVELVERTAEYDLYLIRVANESDLITLEWTDPFGTVIRTETLAPGVLASVEEMSGVYYSVGGKLIADVNSWYWDLDGDGSRYSEVPATSFSIADSKIIGGSKVTVYSKAVSEVPGLPFVIYSKFGASHRLVGIYTAQSDLKSAVENAPDEAFVVLFDEEFTVSENKAINVTQGKKLSIDLNGCTITRSHHTSSYPDSVFALYDKTEFSVYSSIPGARIFLINAVSGGVIFGTDGFVATNATADESVINFGGNIEFNGGTAIKMNGGSKTNGGDLARDNDLKIVVNVHDAVFYSPLRSSYATIVNLAPDVEVTIDNCKFYVTYATGTTAYAVLHDYQDATNAGVTTYYNAETKAVIRNCEIAAYDDSSDNYATLWYTMNPTSSLYIENTSVIGKLSYDEKSLRGKVTVGAGVEISTDSAAYFTKCDISLADGVLALMNQNGGDAEVEITYSHSTLTRSSQHIITSDTKTYLDPDCYDRNKYVTVTISKPMTIATFTADSIPSYIASVEWQNASGEKLGEGFEYVGATPVSPVDISTLEGFESIESNWYVKSCAFINESGKQTVVSGKNVFKPTAKYTANITGKKANMSLSTGMIFNLYLPIPDELVNSDSIVCSEAIEILPEIKLVDGVSMLGFAFESEITEFEAKEIEIIFETADGATLKYAVEIDAMKYVNSVTAKYSCGSDESILAYEIVAYKKAVCDYVGVTLSEAEATAVAAFEAIFAGHGAGCACDNGLYSDADIAATPAPDKDAYRAIGINGFAFLLNASETGLRINVGENVVVSKVTYIDIDGETEIIHDVALKNLKLVETGKERYYIVTGISAANVIEQMTITTSDGSVSYSLAQYIKSNSGVAVAKALYSYAKAAYNFKIN